MRSKSATVLNTANRSPRPAKFDLFASLLRDHLSMSADYLSGGLNLGSGDERRSLDKTNVGRMLTGRCLCGAVHYTVADEFTYSLNCHCSDCRRATGAAFKSFAGIERHKLRITDGKEHVLIFGDNDAGHDVRCRVCGAFLYSVVGGGAWAHVTLGTLVEDPQIRPTAHIFVGDKAPWFEITDRLPQYEGHKQ